ncbi:MAG: mucoidy inhibitor MuiA family protein [Phycisphaerae bacterium]
MKPIQSASVLILLILCLSVPAAEPISVKGTVDAATVYRGQALVTRLVEVSGPVGLREVVVTELPQSIVPGSIYAESANGVEIRSVRYRERPVMQDVRAEVRKLDDQIRKIEDAIHAKNREVDISRSNGIYIDSLGNFIAITANNQASKADFNPKAIQEMTRFIFEQREKVVQEQEVKTSQEIRDLKEQFELLKRQRDTVAGTNAQSVREAVVFVNLSVSKGGRFKFQYLVNNASWSASYNIRANAERKEVTVEYNASVQQMSGEEWSDVAMTLSTATPSLTAKAPKLEPLTIALIAPRTNGPGMMPGGMGPSGPMDDKFFVEQKSKLLRQQRELVSNRAMNMPAQAEGFTQQVQRAPQDRFDADLNVVAKDIQVLEMMSEGKFSKSAVRPAPVDEGVSVTYQLSGRTTLPSRSDQQIIQIAALPMKAEFYKMAIPVLTNYVYEEASLTNESKTVLLAGPVATYLAGQFVGNGAIPTVAIGENITVGFGIDPSLRASRELVERKEDVQGGNRLVDFTYRLALENFGNAPAAMRLFDRLPTTRGTDIKLTLASANPKTTDESKKGILRWDVKVPGQTLGSKALNVEYKFRLEYDKQMIITGLPSSNP